MGDLSGFGNAISQTQSLEFAMMPLKVHFTQPTESQKDEVDESSDMSYCKHAGEV
ncbi:hypothetical protein HETIRDRAFT_330730 [Heterobasidion irregulare TC 32-1]|uniref:Uncharacterized protein n=1 Tax=Heterobasidion irregulare (strain TC 32-1) TaxID=747525 RepID=W4JNW0_HETIT|nr:uncharacterized protein HETIRDRAFT_330730 [Heterobasidion irregulare TC 32-1]ETW75174.1 hypothetical protein HETIRDRAFT_330730 [Heterobasidion irregulare TC 32-1]